MGGMRGNEFKPTRHNQLSQETLAQDWHNLLAAFSELREARGAPNLLVHASSQALFLHERLLALGIDDSEWGSPKSVPVPITRHPKTEAEKREWATRIKSARMQLVMWRAIAAVGTEVILKAVGERALFEAAAAYTKQPAESYRTDLVTLAPVCAFWLVKDDGSTGESNAALEDEALEAMLYAWELVFLAQMFARIKERSADAQNPAMSGLKGWGLANISLWGQAGSRLRRRLRSQAAPRDLYALLAQELPAALRIAWEHREPREPLRSTGKRKMNFARRTARILENPGDETRGTRALPAPGRKKSQPMTELELLTFADRERLLKRAKDAGYSRQELLWFQLVLENPKLKNKEAAAKMGITAEHVGVIKFRANRKRKAVGF